MDDGSSSVQESIKMLRLSRRGGIKSIAATPHFYAQHESPEHFLSRRSEAWKRLSQALPEDVPAVSLGAEVYYYTGISNTEDLSELCIGESRILLLEMPFRRWTERMTDEMVELAQGSGLTVLLAHIDRYLTAQPPDTWEKLAGKGVLFQMNASAFLESRLFRRKVLRLVEDGEITVLGSDCHNMKNRKPNLDEAFAVIRRKLGEETVRSMVEEADRLFAGCRTEEKYTRGM